MAKGTLLAGAVVLVASTVSLAAPYTYTGDANVLHVDNDIVAAAALADQYIQKDITLTVPRSVTLWWSEASELSQTTTGGFDPINHDWAASAAGFSPTFNVDANCRVDLWVFGSDLRLDKNATYISNGNPVATWDGIEEGQHGAGALTIKADYDVNGTALVPVSAPVPGFDSYLMLDDYAGNGVEYNKGPQAFTVGIAPKVMPDVVHAGVYTGKVKVVVMTP